METYSIIIDKSACYPGIEQYYQIQYYLENFTYLKTYICRDLKEIKQATINSISESDFLVVMGKTRAFHEVISGLIIKNKKVPIFFLPSGIFKDLAWNFGALEPVDEYFENAFKNTPLELDVFRLNQSFFTSYAVNSPFLPEVLKEEKKALLKEIGKRILYNKTENHLVNIKMDGSKIIDEYSSFLLGNTQALFGKPIFNYPNLSDGKCEILLMKKMSTLKLLNECLAFLKGECRLDELSCVQKFHGSKISITLEKPLSKPFLIDGAYEPVKEKKIEVEPLTRVRVLRGNTKI